MKAKTLYKNLTTKNLYTTSALAAVALVMAPALSHADVVTGSFVSGAGSFTQSANNTTITVNTANSIANFNQYNVGVGQSVNYENGSSAALANHLSRVTGPDASSILGSINSNGVNLWLINPNGVFFGNTATVNVPNLMVTTSGISDDNFNIGSSNGVYNFDSAGVAGATITNEGGITVGDFGLAALVAPNVVNNGYIVANSGKILLGAGEEFTLDLYGDNLINFATGADNVDRNITQNGGVYAQGGKVLLTVQDANAVLSNVVNMDGVIEASDVQIKGTTVTLGSNAKILARDGNNGGKVAINAKDATVEGGARFLADGFVDGNGGDIKITAENSLNFKGEISAQGKGGGAGGSVETSGNSVIIGNGAEVNLSSEMGDAGEWKINSADFSIGSLGAINMNANTLAKNLENANITIAATGANAGSGNISVDSDVKVNANADLASNQPISRTLKLNAANEINIADGVDFDITGSVSEINRALNLELNAAKNISIGNGSINTQGGNFSANVYGPNPDNSFTSNANINTGHGGPAGELAGDVNIAANTINLNGTVHTSTPVYGGNVTLTSNGGGDINMNGSINAGWGYVHATNTGTGNVTNNSFITGSEVAFQANDGDVTVNGMINSGPLGFDGLVSLISAQQDVNILDRIHVGNAGLVDVQAVNGVVNLDGAITSNGTATITGNTDTVNVLSNDGIINQGIQIVNTGGTVNLAAGTFDQSVLINKSITLSGAGADSTIIAPTYVSPLNSYVSANGSIINPVILVQNANNVQISGIEVDSSGITPFAPIDTGIPVDSSLMIDEVSEYVIESTGIGFDNSVNSSVMDSIIHGNTVNGIHAQNSEGLSISGSAIIENDINGITLENSNNTQILSSNVSGNGNSGIEISGGTNTNVDGVTFENNRIGLAANGVSSGLTIQNSTFIGGANTEYALLISGLVDNGEGASFNPLSLNLSNVVFNGTERIATIRFEDASTFENVTLSNVTLQSVAPVAMQFENVSGGALSDVLDEGDMRFGNTVFGMNYSNYIELINSTMDGDVLNATFVTFGEASLADLPHDNTNVMLSAKIIDNNDNSALGTILFGPEVVVDEEDPTNPVNPITTTGIGNLANSIVNLTDLGAVYYNHVSSVGQTLDNPSLGSATSSLFNTLNNTKVSLNGGNNLGAIAPASGNLADIEPAAGGNAGGGQGDCGTNFGNSFLGDNVSLNDANGSCSL